MVNKKKKCFVIMPFGKRNTEEYERNLKIYRQMLRPVVEECGYQSIRADELEHMGNITRDIIELLHESDLVIADLTGKNANVFYELGVRHALFSCGTIPIIQEGEALPFDIANYRAIFYKIELDGPAIFQKELKKRIQAFEISKRGRSDNPVHDILGTKLYKPDLKNFISLKEHDKILSEISTLKRKLKSFQENEQAHVEKEKKQNTSMRALRKEKNDLQKRSEELKKEIHRLESELKKTSLSLIHI